MFLFFLIVLIVFIVKYSCLSKITSMWYKFNSTLPDELLWSNFELKQETIDEKFNIELQLFAKEQKEQEIKQNSGFEENEKLLLLFIGKNYENIKNWYRDLNVKWIFWKLKNQETLEDFTQLLYSWLFLSYDELTFKKELFTKQQYVWLLKNNKKAFQLKRKINEEDFRFELPLFELLAIFFQGLTI
ncbi:hypothetical protein ACJA25_02965 [Mycoplasmopsis hyopharyngis]|uniref:hypothetical protein n=1 Tax=Mycoplasmopsis hyopharyngis TaxID=29558 RepID=UPI00387326FB